MTRLLLRHEPLPRARALGERDPEALIREARRRTRRRRARVMIAAAVLMVGAVLAYVARSPTGRAVVSESSSRPFANLRAFGAGDGILAFVSRSRLWVLDGRTGSLQVLSAPGQQPADPEFSPDGRWLSYTLENGDQVWVARAGGSDSRRVPGASGAFPSWLPTGELLAGGVVWRIGREGALRRAGSAHDLVGWSVDGRRYAFVSERWSGPLTKPARGVERLSVASSLGGRRTLWLTIPLSFSPASGMSGDLIDSALVLAGGQGIVFKTDPGLGDIADGSGIYEIRAADGQVRQIGFGLALPVAAGSGGELAIANGGNRYQWMTKTVRICSVTAERCATPAVARGVLTLDPAWSPDGRMLAFVEAPSSSQAGFGEPILEGWYATHSLWLLRRHVTAPARIAGTSGASAPVWSANGGSIVYVARDSLWLLRTLSSRPVRIAGPLFERGVWPTFYGQVDWAGQFAWLTRVRHDAAR